MLAKVVPLRSSRFIARASEGHHPPRATTEDTPFRRHSVPSPPSPACRISSPSPILVGRASREAAGPSGSRAGPRPTAFNCLRRSGHERFTSSVEISDADHVSPLRLARIPQRSPQACGCMASVPDPRGQGSACTYVLYVADMFSPSPSSSPLTTGISDGPHSGTTMHGH